jgi:hypothetical protein
MLMSSQVGWRIAVSVQRPVPGAALVDHRIALDLRNDPGRSLIGLAPRFTSALFEALMVNTGELRVDLPADTIVPGRWPRWITTPERVWPVVGELLRYHDAPTLYPFAVWGLPSHDRVAVNAAIDSFRADRMNGALFSRVIELGGARVAGFRSSLTISCGSRQFDALLQAVELGLSASAIQADWREV